MGHAAGCAGGCRHLLGERVCGGGLFYLQLSIPRDIKASLAVGCAQTRDRGAVKRHRVPSVDAVSTLPLSTTVTEGSSEAQAHSLQSRHRFREGMEL